MTGLDEHARLLAQRLPAEVDVVRELLRGLAIAADMGGRLLPLSEELSDVWLALLTTPGLAGLVPDPVELVDVRVGEQANLTDLFVQWLDRYVTTFGPLTPEVVPYWPAARYLAARGIDPTALVGTR